MKRLIILILVAGTLANFGEKLVQFRTSAEVLHRDPNTASYYVECLVENYKAKSKTELSAMLPRELIDELIKINPNSFDSYSALADYEDLIAKFVHKAGVKVLPVISEYIDSYDHKKRSECTELRLAIVSRLASDIDRFDFRLRGTKEGLLLIDSLERALQQIVTDEPGTSFFNGSKGRHQPAAFIFLPELKGRNEVDRSIVDTFRVRYKITLSESEIVDLTNYLILQDPKYPAWSKTKLFKDDSMVNKAGNPMHFNVFKNPKPFYKAYLELKRSKKKNASLLLSNHGK